MLALVAGIRVLNAPCIDQDVMVGVYPVEVGDETKRPAADVRYGPRNEPTAMS